MPFKLPIKILSNDLNIQIPIYATSHSAGCDISAAISEDVEIHPNEVKIIPTGIAIALPIGFEAQIRPRSGLAAKHGITVLNTPGTIDADYRGEIKVIMINHSKEIFKITNGMRIAQMVIAKHETVNFELCDDLESTIRGEKGFGSTGV